MTEKKIVMKINRYTRLIGKKDVIVDNGASIHIPTQHGGWRGYSYNVLEMSKKLFKDLKTRSHIFVDEELTKKANAQYKTPFLTYYRFDIDRMIADGGYTVVEK